jgi:hypothetical protein
VVRAFLRKLKPGAGVSTETKLARNLKFHRKFFSLLTLAYDMWEPRGEKLHRGEPISKCYEQFRADILILAGHYDTIFRIDGSFTFKAKSIAFNSCDEMDFETVYKQVLNVVWDKIFKEAGFRDQAEVENTISQLMSYSG